jgi:hypothetical protein
MNILRTMVSSVWQTLLPLFMASVFLTGCMSWQPEWPATGIDAPSPDVGAMLQSADQLAAVADNRVRLQAAMNAYGRVLDQDPSHTRALTDLANQTILMGTAHTDSRQEKSRHFRSAMRLCERAMYTNADFRILADQGKTPWEACAVLGEEDMPAMMFWSTAVLYYFKEVLTFPEQVFNLSWVTHTGPFLERMAALDPAWGAGRFNLPKVSISVFCPVPLGVMRRGRNPVWKRPWPSEPPGCWHVGAVPNTSMCGIRIGRVLKRICAGFSPRTCRRRARPSAGGPISTRTPEMHLPTRIVISIEPTFHALQDRGTACRATAYIHNDFLSSTLFTRGEHHATADWNCRADNGDGDFADNGLLLVCQSTDGCSHL